MDNQREIEKSQGAPIYVQLREIIRTKIEDGEYIPGAQIPSENELAKLYGLSRLTVRNAIAALVHEGMLKQVQGKGVFVVGQKMERDLETLGGFTQTILEKQAKPSKKVLFKVQRPAGAKYGRIFDIPEDALIYYVRKLCFSDDEPMAIEDTYLPADLIPGFDKVDLALFSLYDIFEYNDIQLCDAWQTLSITTLDAKDARALRIDPEDAVLAFECTSVDSRGRVVEFTRSYTRGDKCSFYVHFAKGSESGEEAFARIMGRRR